MAFLSPAHPSRPGHTPYLPIPTGNRASSSPPAPPLRPPCGGAAPPPPPRGLSARVSSPTPSTTRPRRSLLSPRRVPPPPHPPPPQRTTSLKKQRRRPYPSPSRPDPFPTRYITTGGATGSSPKLASGARFAFPVPHGSIVMFLGNSIRNKLRKHALVSCNQSCH